jgi:Heterokaryon incompatibility protein (HET)
MQSGFDIETAPQAFRDAIPITRALDCRYLWIDSLCIIQHDRAGWENESAMMAEVYSNSYLTISAANSDDDEKGFLRPRPFRYTSVTLTSATAEFAQLCLQKDNYPPKVLGL